MKSMKRILRPANEQELQRLQEKVKTSSSKPNVLKFTLCRSHTWRQPASF